MFGSLGMAVADIPGPGPTLVGVEGRTRGIHFADVDHIDPC